MSYRPTQARRFAGSLRTWARAALSPPGRAGTVILVIAVVASLLGADPVTRPATAAPAAPASRGCPVQQPDRVSAALAARWCHGTVEVSADRTATTQVFAHPDGSFTATVYSGPVRMRDATGAWRPIDLTLAAAADGTIAPKAHPGGLRLSGAQGDGDHDLATMGSGADALALGWHGRLPAPDLTGSRARYRDVEPGVDLLVDATRTGFEFSIEARDRPALRRLSTVSMRLTSPRAVVPDHGAGGLTLRATRGGTDVRMPDPVMWDATVSPVSGEHRRTGRVGLTSTARRGGADLVLRPDPGFVADPSLQFPVTIDPSTTVGSTFSTFVQTGYTSDQSGSTDLKLGYSDDGGSWVARSFLRWDTSTFAGAQVTAATLYLWEYHSWSCTAAQWEVWLTSWADTSTRWTNQPTKLALAGTSSQTKGYSSACNDGWVSAPATGVFQAGATNGWAQTTMGLYATSETNHLSWKRFNSRNAASNVPYATVTFNSAPTVSAQSTRPVTQCATGSGRPYVNTATPTLSAQITDAEGSPVTATFEWWTTGGSMIGTTTTGTQASGTTFTVAVPAAAFTNGGTYSWRVRGADGTATGPYTSFCEFTVDTSEPSSPPGVSSPTFGENVWTGSPAGYTVTAAAGTPYVNGTTVLPLTGDDEIGTVTLPFPVSFYGQSYTDAWIDTNGLIAFDDPGGSHPDNVTALPNPASPNTAVYVFADDLWVDASASMRTAVLGTAPHRQYVVEWNNVRRFSIASDRLSAEAVFTEGSPDIVLNYSGLDNAAQQGSEALVGVESADGTSYQQYSWHTASLANLQALTFHYSAGTAPVSAGTAATFTFTASGVGDVSSYQYGVDENPPSSVVNAPSPGAAATVGITPASDGPHTLYVRSQDPAGNQSAIRAYAFNVGYGGLTGPHLGDLSAGKVALTSVASPAVTGVTYQWRRADTDAWTTIPATDVTVAAGGDPVTWPLPLSGAAFPTLTWDLASTLNDAEGGSDPLDGPLQVRAAFGGGYATPVKITYDRNQASAAGADVGPGSVNLLTGNYALSATDVHVSSYGSDLTVARTFNTRRATSTDSANMFGPGWVSSVAVGSASMPYTQLTVTGSLVQVTQAGGDALGFTERVHTATGILYDAETGDEDLALAYTTAGDYYTLDNGDGDQVTFTRVAGDAAGTYHATAVTTPGSNQSTTLSWEKVTIGGVDVVRPTRMLAPVPTGVSCASLGRGCRALTLVYGSTTTATGTGAGQLGSYLGRLSEVDVTAWDPDASPAAMRTIALIRYLYDSTGRLRQAYDPRLDWTDTTTTPPTTRHLATGYDYDADGIVTTISPAGGLQPWQLSYTTVPGDPAKGRLAAVSRSALSAGTARTTVVYHVPVSGTGSPYDLSAARTVRWGQSEAPVDATAIFDPGQVPDGDQTAGALPSSWTRAVVNYVDANGRPVDTVEPGGYTSATSYDAYGNVVRSLGAGDLDRALGASTTDSPAQEAAIADRESTVNVFGANGTELRETFGPEHDVALSDGSVVRGRAHTVNTYDQGAPNTGGPFHQATTETTSVRYTAGAGVSTDADARTTTTAYDWSLLEPTATTTDPGGLALTTRTAYDPVTGQVTSTTGPAGGTSTTTPATRATVYYRAGSASGYAECDNHPEWANLPCRIQPGGQPGTGAELPVRVFTYDLFGRARLVVDKNSTGTLRTVAIAYDGAGRTSTVTVSGAAGTGTALPLTRTVYDPASGQAVRIQSVDSGGTVTAQVVRQYDTLGRLTSYTDTDGVTSTTTYDLLSRVATSYDGQGTRTYTYDGGSERRGLTTQVDDSQAGVISGSYDAEGSLVAQAFPNGLTVSVRTDETDAPVGITYARPGCGAADCTVFTESIHDSVHGQRRDSTSTLSGQRYGYDAAGRLSTVADTANGTCLSRTYGYNSSTDRTSLTSYPARAADGACQTGTGAQTTTWTYDLADRVSAAGYTYDTLGRTTTLPANDTASPGNGALAATYYVNDMSSTLSQGGRTTTYTLDVTGDRFRSSADSDGSVVTTRTNHYNDDTDSPSWSVQSTGETTRVIEGLTGVAGISSSATGVAWQVANLHGDLVAAMVGTAVVYASDFTEYGVPRDPAAVGSQRYGWGGQQQRSADNPGGITLMGQRLYTPATGRFLSVDPVASGAPNQYDFCGSDAVNCSDPQGTVNCSGSWRSFKQSWSTGIRTYTFNVRCRLSNRETWAFLLLMAMFGSAVIGGLAAFIGALACAGLTPVGSAICGGVTWAVAGALSTLAGFIGLSLYGIICSRQRGVTLRGTYVEKWHWITGRHLSVRYAYPLTPRCN